MRTYKSTMLTPSPLRRKALGPADSDTSAEGELGLETPIDNDDIFSQSPYRPTAPLRSFDAHLRSVAGPSRFAKNSVPFDLRDDDCDDDHLFLSTPAATSTPALKAPQQRTRARRSERPTVPSSRTAAASASRMRTPVKRAQPRPHSTIETSSRRRSPPPPLPRPFSIAQPRTFTSTPPTNTVPLPSASQVTPVSRPHGLRVDTSKTGVKRKSTELPVTMPYRKGMLTPLAVTKTSGEGSFDRLAPLSAPRFRTRSPSQEDAEGFLGGPGTMERLCIGGDRALSDSAEEEEELMAEDAEEAVDVSPGGHIVKRRAKSRPVSWELKHGVGGASQPQQPAKLPKTEVPSLVAFPSSSSTARPRTNSGTSSSSMASPKPRQRLSNASNVSVSNRSMASSSHVRPRIQSIAPPTSLRPPPRRNESSGSATLFFGPAIPLTSTPAKGVAHRNHVADSPPSSLARPLFSGRPTDHRHSYAGSFSSEWPSPTGLSSPGPFPLATDDEEMGEITDEDDERMPDMAMITDMGEEAAEMDEEDLFFSASFNASMRSDEGLGTDPEDSFSWGSTSAPANASFFAINVTESTPSPRGMKAGPKMLEKKYKPRDSGISLTDEEDGPAHAPTHGLVPPRPSGRGFGIGRSGSVSIMLPQLTTSTSASTVASSEDMELFTPGLSASNSSGWPGIVSASASAASDVDALGLVSAFQTDSEVDAFILRTLLQAQSADASASTAAKRPPGTPQKRARIAVGPRPWQSAVATKVGFDYGADDSDGGAGAGDKKAKKRPRGSLPPAFPSLSLSARRKSVVDANARWRDDTEDESEPSPSGRDKGRYEGLGLGRPSAPRNGRTSWLLRRSSSGAISATTNGSQSGEGSWPATPTAGNKNEGWQLPPPRIPSHISPVKAMLHNHLSPARTASSSSGSTTATASPTASRRLFQLSGSQTQARQPSPLKALSLGRSTRRGRASLPVLPGLPPPAPTAEAREGRFEAEFVEVGEVGSGEFGKVMKVRRKGGGGGGPECEAWAVKKSKAFEGPRHRLRLREEVDVLRALTAKYAAATGRPDARHPNVLAYVDSWEQDDALFIQTELCELGNFGTFLWEYGRAFAQLEEARVWKILAELSNGLRFIHAAGVLHLDLKPANIFVTGAGRLKIGDFGMATFWPRPGQTPAAAAAGERPPGFEREGDKCYLAPEVLQGRYGAAADMFSLGITMLETAANIVVPDQGEAWRRLRQDDLSQVDFGTAGPALVGLIRGLLRADAGARLDADALWAHAAVARTRTAMDRAGTFAASPLAPVCEGFLAEVIGGGEDRDAMDCGEGA